MFATLSLSLFLFSLFSPSTVSVVLFCATFVHSQRSLGRQSHSFTRRHIRYKEEKREKERERIVFHLQFESVKAIT